MNKNIFQETSKTVMADQLKKTRGTKKSSITRALKTIERCIVERDKAKVMEQMEKAKSAFTEFEDVQVL